MKNALRFLLVPTIFLFFLLSACTQGKQQESVIGAWKIVETWGKSPRLGEWRTQNIQPSLILFQENYYSVTYVRGDERRPLMADDVFRQDLTAEQAHSVWFTYVSNTGTCEITATQIITHPKVSLWPNFMEGGVRIYDYYFENGILVLSVTEEDVSINMKLQRLP